MISITWIYHERTTAAVAVAALTAHIAAVSKCVTASSVRRGSGLSEFATRLINSAVFCLIEFTNP